MTRESVNFDRAVSFYDATRGFPPGEEANIGTFIARSVPVAARDKLLEVGIGTGRIALPLAAHVRAIYGVDISQGMLRRLQSKPGNERILVALGDAAALPFRHDLFDHALISHVLHLVADPAAVLKELARVLKPGGRLIDCGYTDDNSSPLAVLREAWQTATPNLQAAVNSRQDVHELIARNGWRETGTEQIHRYTFTRTPGDILNSYANRIYSSTWFMSDDELAAGLAAVRQAVHEHFAGDLAIPVEIHAGFSVRRFYPPL